MLSFAPPCILINKKFPHLSLGGHSSLLIANSSTILDSLVPTNIIRIWFALIKKRMLCKGYKAQDRVYKKEFWIQTDWFEIPTSLVFRQLFWFLIIHLWKSQSSSWLIQDCWDKEDYMCKTWKVIVFITSLLLLFWLLKNLLWGSAVGMVSVEISAAGVPGRSPVKRWW